MVVGPWLARPGFPCRRSENAPCPIRIAYCLQLVFAAPVRRTTPYFPSKEKQQLNNSFGNRQHPTPTYVLRAPSRCARIAFLVVDSWQQGMLPLGFLATKFATRKRKVRLLERRAKKHQARRSML